MTSHLNQGKEAGTYQLIFEIQEVDFKGASAIALEMLNQTGLLPQYIIHPDGTFTPFDKVEALKLIKE